MNDRLEGRPPTPTWVKALAVAVVILVLLAVLAVMTGMGGPHGPFRHIPAAS